MLLVTLDGGPGHFYVDGDVAGPGNGSPYAPFTRINDAIAGLGAGGGTIHVDDLTPPAEYFEVVALPSSSQLLGDTWFSQSGQRPTVHAPIDSTGQPGRGSVSVFQANNVSVDHMCIKPSRHTGRPRSRCMWFKSASNVSVTDCVLEGTARGKPNITGLKVGPLCSVTMSHCTLSNLNGDPASTAAIGTINGVVTDAAGLGTAFTMRNCRVEALAATPLFAVASTKDVRAISSGAGTVLTLQNNVFGSWDLGPGFTNTNTFVIFAVLDPQVVTVIDNNVIHDISSLQQTGPQQQIVAIWMSQPSGAASTANWNLLQVTNNIVDTLTPGPGIIQSNATAFVNVCPNIPDYSCVWNAALTFPATGTIFADPLLDPITQALLPGSPCITGGNPTITPNPQMGIFGGPFGGPAGAR